MLTLYVLRHAKSSWTEPLSRDIDRKLNERGLRDAPLMGEYISDLGKNPELILCSPAQRTRETLNLVLPQLGAEGTSIEMPKQLYPGGAEIYLQSLQHRGQETSCILLIGHNPSVADLVVELCGNSNSAQLDAISRKYPTCALSVINFEATDWANIDHGAGTLERFVTPAMLKTQPSATNH